jgi:hypothetical protein
MRKKRILCWERYRTRGFDLFEGSDITCKKTCGCSQFRCKDLNQGPPLPNMFIYNVIMIWCVYPCSMGLGTNTVTNYDITVTSDLIRHCIFANKIPKLPLVRSTLFETEQSLRVNIKSEAALFLFILKEPTVTSVSPKHATK